MSDELVTAVGLVIVYSIAAGLGWLTERLERSPVSRQWTAALSCLAVDEAAAVLRILTPYSRPLLIVSWIALLGGVSFALSGTASLIGRTVSRWPLILAAIAAVLLGAAALYGIEPRVLSVFVFEGLAIALLWAAWLVFRYAAPSGTGRWLTSAALAWAGAYAAIWPLLDDTRIGHQLEFFLDLSVVLCAAAGAYFIHFERARERLQQLAQQEIELRTQLEQSERLEALGRLAGGVAHDFNNVLTTVIHGSELVLRQIEDRPKAAEHLRLVLESAQGAAQFTRQLLSLGRKRMPGRRLVLVQDALSSALGMIRPSLPSQVTLRTTIPERPIAVLSSQGQVAQMVVNLALNAIDSMSDGGTLEILVAANEAQSEITLTVRDTGCGMDDEVRAHIFEPFFSTKNGSGTGLGLAAVYAIAKQLDGSIVVDSKVGQGSEFRIVLPCQPVSDEPQAVPASRPSAPGVTILVVDDQESVLSTVSKGLVDDGYSVTTASSAEEALGKVGQEAPSVLLTDLCMPGTNGLELLRQLRQRFPGLPAILMTAHSNDAELESGRFDVHWLHKPFTRGQLLAALVSALEHGAEARTRLKCAQSVR